MTETTDGFEIAERDLQLRGPGDFFGTRQAGVPTFRVIDLVRDRELLETRPARGGRLARPRRPPLTRWQVARGWQRGSSSSRSAGVVAG